MWTHLPRITVGLLLAAAVATPLTAEGWPRAGAASTEPTPAHAGVIDTAGGPADEVDTIDPAGGPAEPVALVDVPPEIEPMIDWAVDLFARAGLELPPLRFVHHGTDTDPCHGRDGAHRPAGDVSVIELCTFDPSFSTQVMVLHEVAHAWAEHALTPEREAAFRELRGYEHWRDYGEAAWHENGTEQAAEIMVWGLVDRPMGMARITQNSCAELEAGYRTLTGATPLHGFDDHC